MSVARYPFSLTVHLKNGSQLLLDCAIHLNGEWEMCITQLCIPKSQITLFRDCFMTFNYDLQPKTPAKTERDRLWNAKVRKLSLREKQRSIRITLPAGSYDNKAIIEIINKLYKMMQRFSLFEKKRNSICPPEKLCTWNFLKSKIHMGEPLFNFRKK